MKKLYMFNVGWCSALVLSALEKNEPGWMLFFIILGVLSFWLQHESPSR